MSGWTTNWSAEVTSTSVTLYATRAATAATAIAFPAFTNPNVLPRGSQLDVLRAQTLGDLRRHSPLEHARFGRHDAPRRPGYRASRAR